MSKKTILITPSLTLGDGFISVQTMANIGYSTQKQFKNLDSQIAAIAKTNCSFIRLSARNEAEIDYTLLLKKKYERDDFIFIADTHFNEKVSIYALTKGFKKIRINPGNMKKEKLSDLIDIAKEKNAVIRIGLNGGSFREKIGYEFTVTDVLGVFNDYCDFFEKKGFDRLVLSAKFSSLQFSIKANEALSKQFTYPLHLGVTEAGTLVESTVKHSIFLNQLLINGIGATVRVSITGNPLDEIDVANEILKTLGIYKGIEIISCPTCGRTWGNLENYVQKVKEKIRDIDYQLLRSKALKHITIAIMGCEVNGPGEAADADIGVSLTKDFAVLFKKGTVISKIAKKDIADTIYDILTGLLNA